MKMKMKRLGTKASIIVSITVAVNIGVNIWIVSLQTDSLL